MQFSSTMLKVAVKRYGLHGTPSQGYGSYKSLKLEKKLEV